jgi:hypothetical protein
MQGQACSANHAPISNSTESVITPRVCKRSLCLTMQADRMHALRACAHTGKKKLLHGAFLDVAGWGEVPPGRVAT